MRIGPRRCVHQSRRVHIEQAIASGHSRAFMISELGFKGWEIDATWRHLNLALASPDIDRDTPKNWPVRKRT